jgi:hypothetical protein
MRLVVPVAVISALLLGCQLTLISEYDEQIDRSATELQKSMDRFLTELALQSESADPTYYSSFDNYYVDLFVELRSLLIRAESHRKNSITEKQIKLMIKNLEELQKSHMDTAEANETIAPEALEIYRNLFNQGWKAIIELEMAKKRGEG